MGEKGAEVAAAPVQAAPSSDAAAVAATVASLFSGALDAGAAMSPATTTAQPIGELGPELPVSVPGGLTPSIPTFPSASPGATPATPSSLAGLKPTADTMTGDLDDPGSALRP